MLRILVLSPLLLLAALWWSPAHAATVSDAMASCESFRTSASANTAAYSNVGSCTDLGGHVQPGTVGNTCNPTAPSAVGPGYVCVTFHSNYAGADSANVYGYDFPSCASGSTYSTTTHQCEVPFDAQKCLAHNSEPGFSGVGDTVRAFECANVGGCEFKAVGPHVSVADINSPSQKVWYGHFEFTGNPGSACANPLPQNPQLTDAANPKNQECTPMGTLTQCLRSDGKQCVKSASGRYLCWGATEIGTKTDGSVVQQRNGGNQPATPPAPPPGDTITQTGTGTSSVTTINNTTTNTSTVTTTNYQTGSGADASTGGHNDGEADDGNGGGKTGGDHGSASGGTDCHTPPTLTPGDNPLLAHLDNMTWLQRCQGLDGISPEIDAAKLVVQAQEDAFNNTNDPDAWEAYYNAHKSDTPDGAGAIDKSSIDTSGLDGSGWLGGSATCPTFPDLVVGNTHFPIKFDPICNLFANYGLLVVAFGYLLAAKMIATS